MTEKILSKLSKKNAQKKKSYSLKMISGLTQTERNIIFLIISIYNFHQNELARFQNISKKIASRFIFEAELG